MKNSCFDATSFDKANWEAHHHAINHLSRLFPISITKSAHGLYRTNQRAHQMYGIPVTCPCCNLCKATLMHVFTYPSVETASFWHAVQQTLCTVLLKLKATTKIIEMMLHGLTSWEHLQ
jgi:hypothetical protein